jgi:hypothetical protein
MLEIPGDMFPFGVSRYVPERPPVITDNVRPDGVRVRKTTYESGLFEEFVVYPGVGIFLDSIFGKFIYLKYSNIKYFSDRKPYEVSHKKTILNVISTTSSTIDHNYVIEYNEDGSFFTIDKSITSGILMKRKYVPISNEVPIRFVDGSFIDTNLVEETQI